MNRYSQLYAPPPFDRCNDFPRIIFDKGGVPHVGKPGGIPRPVVVQIVPSTDNPYIQTFGDKGYRDWATPEETLKDLTAWAQAGKDVIIHPQRHPGVHAIGVSHGRARFICGSGMSVFVVQEKGPLPDGTKFGESTLDKMVAAIAISTPSTDRNSATYHLIPAEYLTDPEYPGLPAGLSPSEIHHWLAPPPEFHHNVIRSEFPGFYHALVEYDISDKEAEEGGLTILQLTTRGRSYLPLNGLPPA